jgi:thiamine-phosphate pyrophosphorylase
MRTVLYARFVTARPLRYAISDRNLAGAPDEEGRLSASKRDAILAQAVRLGSLGVDFFQLRERDLEARILAELTRDLLQALTGSGTRLLVNRRADVALAARAHGVHLSAWPDELTPTQVHTLYARAALPPPLVTVSCHSLAEIDRLREQPVNAILFGPVFGKSVGGRLVQVGTGLELLQQACEHAAPLPVLALGGITPDNSAGCLAAGAAGLAAIRLFLP